MYIIVAVFSILILLKSSRLSLNKSLLSKLYLIIILVLGIFRDTCIGTDINIRGGYYDVWFSPFSSSCIEEVEYGFLLLTSLIKKINSSYTFYYGFIYFLTMLIYFLSVKKILRNPAVFFAIYFLSSSIISSFNTIRQELALAFSLLVFFHCIGNVFTQVTLAKANNKMLIWRLVIYELLILIISYTIHGSVLILIMLPIFYIRKIQELLSKDVVLWILLFAVFCINVLYGVYIQLAVIWLQSTLHIGGRADFWISVIERFGDDIVSTHGSLTILISGSIAILASKNRRDVLFYMGFVGFLLSSLASANLGTVGRVFNNISIFLVVYYARIFGNILVSYKIKNLDLRWLVITLLLFDWLTGFYFTTILNNTVSPYKSYLFL